MVELLYTSTPWPNHFRGSQGLLQLAKEQPGLVAGYHAQDSKTGSMASIIIWDSEERMAALRDRIPPGGPLGIQTERLELFDVVEEF